MEAGSSYGGVETPYEAVRASPRVLAVCLGDWRGMMKAKVKELFYCLSAVNEEGAGGQGQGSKPRPSPRRLPMVRSGMLQRSPRYLYQGGFGLCLYPRTTCCLCLH